MLTLSQRERDRLVVVRRVATKQSTVSEGARRLGVGPRQMRRPLRHYEAEGDRTVVHGLRGSRPNRSLAEGLREQALEEAGDPLYRAFGPTLLSEHLARDATIGPVHPGTVRLFMIERRLWTPRERSGRHRRRRARRSARGELVLMDTSIHAWLQERSADEIVLIALIADATIRLEARFFPPDTGAANRQMLLDDLAAHGRMGAVYAGRAGHFEHHFNPTKRRGEDQEAVLTLIERALGGPDSELIHAPSPQARGRVERLFGTLHDRLAKETRVAGIRSPSRPIASSRTSSSRSGTRSTAEPGEPTDAHRPPDVKYLRDIAAYWPQREALGPAGYAYTIRAARSGAVFLAFGRELGITYASLSSPRCRLRLGRFGIEPADVTVQADQASELDGAQKRPS